MWGRRGRNDHVGLQQLREEFGERHSARVFLADGFIGHDDAAAELHCARSTEEHFAIRTPAFFSGLDPEGIEPLGQGGNGFVRRKDALSPNHQRCRDTFWVLVHPAIPQVVFYFYIDYYFRQPH